MALNENMSGKKAQTASIEPFFPVIGSLVCEQSKQTGEELSVAPDESEKEEAAAAMH